MSSLADLYLMTFYDKLLRVAFIEMEDIVAVVLELEGDEGFADEVGLDALLVAVFEVGFADEEISVVY